MWKQMIKDVGIQKIADETGVTYAAIRKYVVLGTIPKKNMNALCRAMEKHLTGGDFRMFMDSLFEGVTGYSDRIHGKSSSVESKASEG